MRTLIIYGIILLLSIETSKSQDEISVSSGYSYLKHSHLNGIFLSNDFNFDKLPYQFSFGYDLNYAVGNRNISKNEMGSLNYLINKDDSIFIPWNIGYLDSPLFVLPVKTSNTYQITLKSGVAYNIPKWSRVSFLAGIYFTFVNKSYLLPTLRNVNLNNATADFVIPYYIRYIDVGSYIGFNMTLIEKGKIQLGIKSVWFIGFENNGWFNIGISSRIFL